MIKCPVCDVEHSCGRYICYDCENSSIYFGKISENREKVYKWNSNTTIICMALVKKELKFIDSVIEKVSDNELRENKFNELDCNYTMRFNEIQFIEKKNHFFNI